MRLIHSPRSAKPRLLPDRLVPALVVVALTALTATLIGGGGPAAAAPEHDRLIGSVPTFGTPNIVDGYPNAILQIGDRVVVGGTFSAVVDRPTNQTISRPYLFAFDPNTGAVDPQFAPTIANEVLTLLPGPTPNTVYVGGRMNHVNGVNGYSKLVLLNLDDGSLVTGFRAPSMNAAAMSVKRAHGRLLVAGTFTTVGGVSHGGLVALDPLTGARLDYVDIELTEHHNYDGTGARAPVGGNILAVTPDESRAVLIGNFRFADGLDRDQVVLLDLTEESAEIADWQTEHYKPACGRNSFDKWVRDVSMSPDGSYFVIATTGGPFRNTLCDTIARFETHATGEGQNPTWVNWSGGDTLLSVTVTETAVYTGGHQRWMNNHWGRDYADTGAVGRPGISAHEPATGVPFSWNPGRHPRGYGATALYPTPDGLFVGMDTNFVGNHSHRREKIAFLPLDGTTPPPNVAATLPADLHFVDVPVAAGVGLPEVLYRINAGGFALPAIDDGPDWQADRDLNSPFRTVGSNWSNYNPPIPNWDPSVPSQAPLELFHTRRWDSPNPPSMQWSFPVPAGLPVEVRLYLAERTWSHNQPGTRVFDIDINGEPALPQVDVAATAGYNTAMMVTAETISTGTVDIDFVRDVSDPAVYGIELVLLDVDPDDDLPGIAKRSFDGVTLGPEVPVGGADGTAWGDVRGIFAVDDQIFYGMADGNFYRRSFDGVTFGLPEVLTPHSDPNWDGAPTASGTSTYSGAPTSGFATAMTSMRGMYYADGRIFYTRSNQNTLYWRWFNPENGLASSREFTLPGSGVASSLTNLSNTSGLLFVHDDHVYWVRAADGRLVRRPLVDNGPGSEQVTTATNASRGLVWGAGPAEAVGGPNIDGIDWRTPGAFLRAAE